MSSSENILQVRLTRRNVISRPSMLTQSKKMYCHLAIKNYDLFFSSTEICSVYMNIILFSLLFGQLLQKTVSSLKNSFLCDFIGSGSCYMFSALKKVISTLDLLEEIKIYPLGQNEQAVLYPSLQRSPPGCFILSIWSGQHLLLCLSRFLWELR